MDEIKDYIEYPESVKKYDTSKLPKRQNLFFTTLLYIASSLAVATVKGGSKMEKINMAEALKSVE